MDNNVCLWECRCHGNLDALRQAFGHVRGQLVADHWALFQSEQDGGQTLSAAGQHGGFPATTLKHKHVFIRSVLDYCRQVWSRR